MPFSTNTLPSEDYTAVYFSFEKYSKRGATTEHNFLRELQRKAQSGDSSLLKNMIARPELHLLSNSYYGNYFYAEIKKIFKNYTIITPIASIKTDEGKLL